jgi:hypothetical protein
MRPSGLQRMIAVSDSLLGVCVCVCVCVDGDVVGGEHVNVGVDGS